MIEFSTKDRVYAEIFDYINLHSWWVWLKTYNLIYSAEFHLWWTSLCYFYSLSVGLKESFINIFVFGFLKNKNSNVFVFGFDIKNTSI